MRILLWGVMLTLPKLLRINIELIFALSKLLILRSAINNLRCAKITFLILLIRSAFQNHINLLDTLTVKYIYYFDRIVDCRDQWFGCAQHHPPTHQNYPICACMTIFPPILIRDFLIFFYCSG